MKAIVTMNPEKNGIEIAFEAKPTADTLAALKSNGFRWHRSKKVWYATQTAERITFAQSLTGDEIAPVEAVKASEPVQFVTFVNWRKIVWTVKADKYGEYCTDEVFEFVCGEYRRHPSEYNYNNRIGYDMVIEEYGPAYPLDAVPAYEMEEESRFSDFFDHSANALFHIYEGMNDKEELYITDLTNATKTGKECRRWTISRENGEEWRPDLLAHAGIYSTSDIMDALRSDAFNVPGLIVRTISSKKGVNTYSPFAVVKPIKTPKKWTISHFWKAVMAGQISAGKCRGVYTDDYAYDAAVNYGEGDFSLSGVVATARKVMEDSSGWWVSDHAEENGIISLFVCCHHFDTNTFYFDPAGRLPDGCETIGDALKLDAARLEAEEAEERKAEEAEAQKEAEERKAFYEAEGLKNVTFGTYEEQAAIVESVESSVSVSPCHMFASGLKDTGYSKLSTVYDYKKRATDESTSRINAEVSRIVKMDADTYGAFAALLLCDFSFLSGMGGSKQSGAGWISSDCVAVYCGDVLKMVIDPQGFGYARYVYFVDELTTVTGGESEQVESSEAVTVSPSVTFAPGLESYLQEYKGRQENETPKDSPTIETPLSVGEWLDKFDISDPENLDIVEAIRQAPPKVLKRLLKSISPSTPGGLHFAGIFLDRFKAYGMEEKGRKLLRKWLEKG